QKEFMTRDFLQEKRKPLHPDFLIPIAHTGILTGFLGKEKGKKILFRAHMDALPIQELNDFPYRSRTDGISDKCGHDGHAPILYGLARYFSEQKPKRGNALLLFQPAEENGWGAQAVMKSQALKAYAIDYAIALHNLPGFPLHEIVCKSGSFTSSVVSLRIDFPGYTAHAGEPGNGKNPAVAMSRLVIESAKWNLEEKSKQQYVTITPVFSELGSKNYGISAGYGTVHLTIRADSNERLQKTLEAVKSLAESLA